MTASIALLFLGLATLIAGYTVRDCRAGPLLIWVGVALMLAVIVHHIFTALG